MIAAAAQLTFAAAGGFHHAVSRCGYVTVTASAPSRVWFGPVSAGSPPARAALTRCACVPRTPLLQYAVYLPLLCVIGKLALLVPPVNRRLMDIRSGEVKSPLRKPARKPVSAA